MCVRPLYRAALLRTTKKGMIARRPLDIPWPTLPASASDMGSVHGAQHFGSAAAGCVGHVDLRISAMSLTRRNFLQSSALSLASLAAAGPAALAQGDAPKIRLGIDNFAVRAMGWKAKELIDYAASLKVDTLFITDLDAFESLDTKPLQEIRKQAADSGIELLLGTWSICPTSTAFRNNRGTAEEHLRLGIRAAKDLGSPVIRVILGRGDDRATPGGIEARIADTVAVCKTCRSEAIDSGVKIAVENHAGDMQSGELVQLIEEAGRDYVGANMDSGNAVWTLEDPLTNLETLAPYVLTTSLRDSAIWESAKGVTVQWTAMGDGNVDLKTYFRRFAELCPQVAVNIETISGFNRELPYLTDDYWKAWPKAKAHALARVVAIAKTGKPRPTWSASEGVDRKKAEQDYQKSEVERSIAYCKKELGLGRKA
jgi:sugar phosphate isomerase/epimerase